MIFKSCRKDFDFEPAQINQFQFSADTIFLDTVFNNITTSTKILTVKNSSDQDISINSVRLRRGVDSKYQLNVDGTPNELDALTPSSGKIFDDVELLANDSIFIFIEATIDPVIDDLDAEQNYLDEILFETNSGTSEVQLSTQVIDADFSFNTEEVPPRVFETTQRDENGDFIEIRGYDLTPSELNINSSKARVIFGNAVVPSGATLNIEGGSRVYFNRDSGLIIEDGARLEITGGAYQPDAENPLADTVILESNQLDEDFDNLAGQWNFIWLQPGATASINNTIIKNATTGIWVQSNAVTASPNLELNNVQIYNSQTVGIQASTCNITATNLVINQSAVGNMNIENGGNYDFTHCTFSNTFRFGGVLQSAIHFSESGDNTTTENLNANFTNCIITGNRRDEINVNTTDNTTVNLNFQNCLINLTPNNFSNLDISDTTIFENCIFGESAEFKNTRLNDLRISEESAANGAATFITGEDILNSPRNNPSDIGAYESILFEEE